jgi:hypothetical protein
VQRAVEIAGSAEKLRRQLGVEAQALELWIRGSALPPDRIFSAMVDVLLEHDIAMAAMDRRQTPRASPQRSATG